MSLINQFGNFGKKLVLSVHEVQSVNSIKNNFIQDAVKGMPSEAKKLVAEDLSNYIKKTGKLNYNTLHEYINN